MALIAYKKLFKKNTVSLTGYRTNGSAVVRISNKLMADLKRIAELDTKMTEFDKLGVLMKLRNEKEKLIPKITDKKKKIRAK